MCRAATGQKIVGGQTSGRDRCDILGAVDPEHGNARIIEVPTVDAWRRIAPLTAIAVMDPFRFARRSGTYPDSLKIREKFLAFSDWTDSVARSIQSGVLGEEVRKALTALAREASSRCRVTRRANALVLLGKGWSCQEVAHAFLLDDDTIRG